MTDQLTEQSPVHRLAELQVVSFIHEALRSGQRAILITGRDRYSTRVPEAAIAGCVGGPVRALHIGPPLPELAGLQRMIGAAVGIAGGPEMEPIAMAARLLFSDARQTLILAIDDAHTLSHRSLSYLMEVTELLAPDATVLQIVLAADPVLLETLAQPEFERLRGRLCRPEFETRAPLGELRRTTPTPVRKASRRNGPRQNGRTLEWPVRSRLRRRIVGVGGGRFSHRPRSRRQAASQPAISLSPPLPEALLRRGCRSRGMCCRHPRGARQASTPDKALPPSNRWLADPWRPTPADRPNG